MYRAPKSLPLDLLEFLPPISRVWNIYVASETSNLLLITVPRYRTFQTVIPSQEQSAEILTFDFLSFYSQQVCVGYPGFVWWSFDSPSSGTFGNGGASWKLAVERESKLEVGVRLLKNLARFNRLNELRCVPVSLESFECFQEAVRCYPPEHRVPTDEMTN